MDNTFLKLYLVINVLLVVSYVFIKAIRWALDCSEKNTFSYLTINRVAQSLFLLAIFVPLGISLLPTNAFSPNNILIHLPLSDGISSDAFVKEFSSINIKAVGVTVPIAAPVMSLDLKLVVIAFVLLSMLFAFGKSIFHLKQLTHMIQRSYLIRKIGKVNVFVSEEVTIPFSTLVGGVNVVLPMQWVSNLHASSLIIRHELHHHRNGDTLWVLIMEAACCFFYLNPMVRLWKKEISEIQEFACDETLIRQRRVSAYDYGQCLIKVAEAASRISAVQVGTICMGASPQGPRQIKSFLRRRIQVFNKHETSRKRHVLGFLIGIIGSLSIVTISYAAQQMAHSKPQQKINEGSAQFDPEIHKATEEILSRYVKKFKAQGGFVVVVDSRSGKVLSVANELQEQQNLKKHWALSYQLEPASALKPLIAASALEGGFFKVDDKINCENGKYTFGGQTYSDWKAMGILTMGEFIAQSSNICGIKVGEKMGVAALESTLKDFGFGSQGSASEFPEAMPGRYPRATEMSAENYIPLLASGMASSEGFSVTPLEIAQAYGAIANGGKLLKPLDTKSTGNGQVVRQVISEQTASKMKEILKNAVENGTGSNARSSKYSTAGKTSSLAGKRAETMAGFVGFAPVKNPSLVVYVGILSPTNSADKKPHGNEHAAPVFREVIETVLPTMNVSPDKVL